MISVKDLEQDRQVGKKVAVRKEATGDIFYYVGLLERNETTSDGKQILRRDTTFIRSDGIIETASSILSSKNGDEGLKEYSRLHEGPPDFSVSGNNVLVTDREKLINRIGYIFEPDSLRGLFKATKTLGLPAFKGKDSDFILTQVTVQGNWETPHAPFSLSLAFIGASGSVYEVDLSKGDQNIIKKLKIKSSSMYAHFFVPEAIGRKETLSPIEED